MHITAKKNKISGKKTSHRRSMERSLLLELIRHNSLKTTAAKSRILTAQFDRLVTTAKQDTLAAKRLVEATLQNDLAVEKLYSKILPEVQDVTSGYTYTARTLPRKGDNAPQTIILVRGQEVKEKQTRLQKLLSKQEKKEDKTSAKPKAERKVREAKISANESKAKNSNADTRRVSM